jgi:hypothetical protein
MTGAPRERSGCLIALYALFAVGLFVLVLGALTAYVALRSPQGQKVVEAAKQGMSWILEAQRAPGTAELREAGCDTALVTNLSDATEVFKELMPEQAHRELEEGAMAQQLEHDMVICVVGRMMLAPPGCSELARIYAIAADAPSESFIVRVQRQGHDAAACQGLYDGEGEFIESIEDK